MGLTKKLTNITVGNEDFKLYIPDENEIRSHFEKGNMPTPYWAQIWPAARSLAIFIKDRPELVKGLDVLEIAGGLGLPSLVTAQFAKTVLCTDIDLEAIEFVSHSATLHNLTNLKTGLADWHKLPNDVNADVLLLSDVNYAPTQFEALYKMMHSFLDKGTRIIISTPQRLAAKEFMLPLMSFCSQRQNLELQHNNHMVNTTVFILEGKPPK